MGVHRVTSKAAKAYAATAEREGGGTMPPPAYPDVRKGVD